MGRESLALEVLCASKITRGWGALKWYGCFGTTILRMAHPGKPWPQDQPPSWIGGQPDQSSPSWWNWRQLSGLGRTSAHSRGPGSIGRTGRTGGSGRVGSSRIWGPGCFPDRPELTGCWLWPGRGCRSRWSSWGQWLRCSSWSQPERWRTWAGSQPMQLLGSWQG